MENHELHNRRERQDSMDVEIGQRASRVPDIGVAWGRGFG